ncbi:MAG: sulfite exporter TauE/SafE family protein [Candidatus Puniceispirillaceae bacterium]
MSMYLPIAEMATNPFVIVFFGALVGAMSGMFGVGGGFLMAPILFFLGIPPSVAVSTEATQICAASVSGSLAHFRRGNLDIKMGVLLTGGGLLGSTVGVFVFRWLVSMGSVDLVIQIFYVLFLGGVGGMMLVESLQAILRRRAGKAVSLRRRHGFMHGLPFRTKFPRSKLYISALLPITVGVGVGFLSAIMGVGGGFIMVPAMIYLLGMPTLVVVGTSLFQIIFVTANVTLLQSVQTQTVDFMLAGLLLFGAVIGAQFGTRAGALLRGEQLRGLLALIVLAVCLKLGFELAIRPDDLFSVELLK